MYTVPPTKVARFAASLNRSDAGNEGNGKTSFIIGAGAKRITVSENRFSLQLRLIYAALTNAALAPISVLI